MTLLHSYKCLILLMLLNLVSGKCGCKKGKRGASAAAGRSAATAADLDRTENFLNNNPFPDYGAGGAAEAAPGPAPPPAGAASVPAEAPPEAAVDPAAPLMFDFVRIDSPENNGKTDWSDYVLERDDPFWAVAESLKPNLEVETSLQRMQARQQPAHLLGKSRLAKSKALASPPIDPPYLVTLQNNADQLLTNLRLHVPAEPQRQRKEKNKHRRKPERIADVKETDSSSGYDRSLAAFQPSTASKTNIQGDIAQIDVQTAATWQRKQTPKSKDGIKKIISDVVELLPSNSEGQRA